jgi:SOS response regulatory protein OraA/RecX
MHALSMMSRVYRTAAELAQRLGDAGHSEGAAAAAIARLQALGLQSDALYAESAVRFKWEYQAKAPGAIRAARCAPRPAARGRALRPAAAAAHRL